MKSFMFALSFFVTLSAFADCRIFIDQNDDERPLSENHLDILKVQLSKRITDNIEEADYVMKARVVPKNRFKSHWYAIAEIKKPDAQNGTFIMASDTFVTLALHMSTMAISGLIPGNGDLATRNLAANIPSCEEIAERLH